MGCIVLFTICMATNTMAEGNAYYVNDYGVEFTETEYNTLLDSEISNVTGTQETNVGTTNYTYASSNTKILSNGVGISMDLYNNATTKIKCTMQCKFGSGADPFTVFGTYQHATSDLSLSDSQKYKLAVGGMGDVLEFTSSSVKAKYDNTSGLCVTGSINDQ